MRIFTISTAFGPQNHETCRFYTPKIWVITPKNEGFGFPWWFAGISEPSTVWGENNQHMIECNPVKSLARFRAAMEFLDMSALPHGQHLKTMWDERFWMGLLGRFWVSQL